MIINHTINENDRQALVIDSGQLQATLDVDGTTHRTFIKIDIGRQSIDLVIDLSEGFNISLSHNEDTEPTYQGSVSELMAGLDAIKALSYLKAYINH